MNNRWRLKERFGLLCRCDFFNLPNRSNFGAPNTARGNAAFGTIRAAYDPRTLQMNLRFVYRAG